MIWFPNAGDGFPYRWKEPTSYCTSVQSMGKPRLQSGSPCLYRLRGNVCSWKKLRPWFFLVLGYWSSVYKFCFKPSHTAGWLRLNAVTCKCSFLVVKRFYNDVRFDIRFVSFVY